VSEETETKIFALLDIISVEVVAGRSDIRALDAKVTALDAKVTALDAKVTALDAKVDHLHRRLGRVETRVEGVETEIKCFEENSSGELLRSSIHLKSVFERSRNAPVYKSGRRSTAARARPVARSPHSPWPAGSRNCLRQTGRHAKA
jgi:outer membrane murein-binding lipoprotein Lpp